MIVGKCLVTSDVEMSIREGLSEVQKFPKINSGVLHSNQDGKLSSYFFSDDDKLERKTFWANTMNLVSKITKEEIIIDENGIYDELAALILDADISSIELSKKTDRIFVCDDLFIRKIHHSITKSTNTTNIVGLLISESLVTLGELLDLIEKLVKCKYLYPISASVFYELYNHILSIENIEEKQLYFKKFKEVFKNIHDNVSGPYYKTIYEEFINNTRTNELPYDMVSNLSLSP